MHESPIFEKIDTKRMKVQWLSFIDFIDFIDWTLCENVSQNMLSD